MKTVIFDLDGTIALIDHRRSLVEQSYHHERWAKEASEKFNVLYGESVINRSYEDDYIERMNQAHEYIKQKRKEWKPEWDEFYQRCVNDEPNEPVIETLTSLYKSGFRIVIFSGRSDVVRPQTQKWLRDNLVMYDALVMRADKNYTPDHELKKQWLETHFINKSDILCVFDDRQKVVDMWRAEGIPCFQVAPGDF